MRLKQNLFILCLLSIYVLSCQNLKLRMDNDSYYPLAEMDGGIDADELKEYLNILNKEVGDKGKVLFIFDNYIRNIRAEEPIVVSNAIVVSNESAENLKVIDELVNFMISEIENKKDSISFGRNELEMVKKEAIRVRQELENGVVSLHELKEQVKNNINHIALGYNDVRNEKITCKNCGEITYLSKSQILSLDNSIWGGPWYFIDKPDVLYPTLAECYVARADDASDTMAHTCIFCYKQAEVSTRENDINKLKTEKELIISKLVNEGEQINQEINENKEVKSITEKIETKQKSLRKMCEQDEKISNALEHLVEPDIIEEDFEVEYPDEPSDSDTWVIL
jgi:hypothetical protein